MFVLAGHAGAVGVEESGQVVGAVAEIRRTPGRTEPDVTRGGMRVAPGIVPGRTVQIGGRMRIVPALCLLGSLAPAGIPCRSTGLSRSCRSDGRECHEF